MRNQTFPGDFLERGREDAGIPGFHEFTFYRAQVVESFLSRHTL